MQPHFFRHLILVKLANGMRCKFHGGAHFWIERFFSFGKIRVGGGKLRGRNGSPLKVVREAGQSLVAFGPNRIDDQAGLLLERGEISFGALLQLCPLRGRKRRQFMEFDPGGHETS